MLIQLGNKTDICLDVYGETTKHSVHVQVLESDCWGLKSWLYYSITLGELLPKTKFPPL